MVEPVGTALISRRVSDTERSACGMMVAAAAAWVTVRIDQGVGRLRVSAVAIWVLATWEIQLKTERTGFAPLMGRAVVLLGGVAVGSQMAKPLISILVSTRKFALHPILNELAMAAAKCGSGLGLATLAVTVPVASAVAEKEIRDQLAPYVVRKPDPSCRGARYREEIMQSRVLTEPIDLNAFFFDYSDYPPLRLNKEHIRCLVEHMPESKLAEICDRIRAYPTVVGRQYIPHDERFSFMWEASCRVPWHKYIITKMPLFNNSIRSPKMPSRDYRRLTEGLVYGEGEDPLGLGLQMYKKIAQWLLHIRDSKGKRELEHFKSFQAACLYVHRVLYDDWVTDRLKDLPPGRMLANFSYAQLDLVGLIEGGDRLRQLCGNAARLRLCQWRVANLAAGEEPSEAEVPERHLVSILRRHVCRSQC